MRKDLSEFFQSSKQLNYFIRENPVWYRRLSRDPSAKHAFELASRAFHKQTFPYKVEKFSNSLEFASMMMQMYSAMKQGD